jgi:hypothetical protein
MAARARNEKSAPQTRQRFNRAKREKLRSKAMTTRPEIARLAKLSLIEYGRQRKPVAQPLGCPVSILDRAVAAERGNGGAAHGQGRPLDLT